jgi:hypothetical protein
MNRVLASLLTFCFLTACPLTSVGDDTDVTLTINVHFSCGGSPVAKPDLHISGPASGLPGEIQADWHQTGAFDFTTAVTVPPGTYIVKVTNPDYRGCGAFDLLTLLPTHARHAFFVVSKYINISDADLSIAGALPFQGLVVQLIGHSGEPTPVTVDGEAYYADNLPRGNYALQVYFQGLLRFQTCVAAGAPTIRNISEKDLVAGAEAREILPKLCP